jgi:signal peptide peptidase SppA
MTMRYPHILSRIVDTPLLVHPGKATTIASALMPRLLSNNIQISGPVAVVHRTEQLGRLGDPLGRAYAAAEISPLRNVVDGVAVIAIEGTLVHKGDWVGAWSGETSYEGIQTQVAAARRNASIRAVVFEVDSYGGEQAGAYDTADMIAELSAEKPTIAILTDFAYSGGYLLAAAARAIIMPETGGAGSIGVTTMHVDFSKALENDGVKVTILSSGAHKADGNPFEPLDPAVAKRVQADLDAGRDIFAAAVGRYRGQRLTKQMALATEADVFRGEAAVRAGLVDGIARPTEAFETFVRAVNGR